LREIAFTEIEDIKVGHTQNLKAATGCTVILCEESATAGVDVRGGAPGTRETDLLNPVNLIEAKRMGGDSVKVKLSVSGHGTTLVKIRVGIFGDEVASRTIERKIASRVGF
jgi:hypothetical protein